MEMNENFDSNENVSTQAQEVEHDGLRNFIILLVVVLVIIGLYLLFFGQKGTNDVDLNNVLEVSQEEVLAVFPLGLPIEEGIEASESYRFVPANSSEKQSTISYKSNLSFEENSEAFEKFFVEGGYDIRNEIDDTGTRFFYAQKDETDISIDIEEYEGVVNVNISYLER